MASSTRAESGSLLKRAVLCHLIILLVTPTANPTTNYSVEREAALCLATERLDQRARRRYGIGLSVAERFANRAAKSFIRSNSAMSGW